MGTYLNPGNGEFYNAVKKSKIYVDKTELLKFTNSVLCGEQKDICVSRPRRFGKSMTANMLVAYYSKGCESKELFDDLKVAEEQGYEEHLNKYNVIHINMIDFLSRAESMDGLIDYMQRRLLWDIKKEYSDVDCFDWNDLVDVLETIYSEKKQSFVIIIDEWDCIFRKYPDNVEEQKKYLDFLRFFIKGKSYVALAYMTGILPIKKYGSHSALNMFTEYSMTDPGDMAEYFGFTEQEVSDLCKKYQMSFDEAKQWYDGYDLIAHHQSGDRYYSMYSPKSVVEAMLRHKFGTYWNQTETYEALKIYIQMDMDGLQDSVVRMLAGESVSINIGTFSNDMTTFATKDDILTLLVHLGYLTYDSIRETAAIPNKEVSQEYVNAISTMNWHGVADSVESSRKLLEALWAMDADTVASGIDKAHEEMSILQYNDENSLSCTVNLAFYFAREYYTMIRELPSGKGFADICMIPRKTHLDKPAVVIELKWDKSAAGALNQIKEKNYGSALKDYQGNLLLVGINYDRVTKKHECVIEVAQKQL